MTEIVFNRRVPSKRDRERNQQAPRLSFFSELLLYWKKLVSARDERLTPVVGSTPSQGITSDLEYDSRTEVRDELLTLIQRAEALTERIESYSPETDQDKIEKDEIERQRILESIESYSRLIQASQQHPHPSKTPQR